jgi:hypothetical protein
MSRCAPIPCLSLCTLSMIVPPVDERLIYGTGERQRCLAVGNLVVGAVEQIPLGGRRPLSANQPLMLFLIQSFPLNFACAICITDVPNQGGTASLFRLLYFPSTYLAANHPVLYSLLSASPGPTPVVAYSRK